MKIKTLIIFIFCYSCFANSTYSQEEKEVAITGKKEVVLTKKNIKRSFIGSFRTQLLYGFRDGNNIIIPFEYTDLPSELSSVMRAKKDGKYGFINDKNEIVIPFIYDDIWFKFEGFMRGTINEKKGYINSNGETIVPFEFEEVFKIPFEKNSFIGLSENGVKKYDSSGKEITTDYVYYHDFFTKKEISVGYKNGTYGMINHNNEVVKPFEYHCPLEYFKSDQWKTCKNGKYGIIDNAGAVLLPFDYEDVESLFYTKWFKIKEGEKAGIVNNKGEVIVPVEYDNVIATGFDRGNIKLGIAEKDGLKGVYNEIGKLVVPIHYDYLKLIKNKFIKVGKGDFFGLYSKTGKKILPCEFDRTFKFSGDIIQAVRLGERMGKYSSNGELIPQRVFNHQKILGNYFIVSDSDSKDAKKGLMDRAGNLLSAIEFSSIKHQQLPIQGAKQEVLISFFIFSKEGKCAFYGDFRHPKIYQVNEFKYSNLAFGFWKKDEENFRKQGIDTSEIIGYFLSDKKERIYISMSGEEVKIE